MGRARGWIVAATLAWFGCAPVLPGVPGQGGAAWLELTSDHFTVWTNVAPGEARALVRKLERFRQIVAGVAFPDAPRTGRSLVIALRDDRELRAFAWNEEARAFAISAQAPLWQPTIVLSLDGGGEDHTIVHELTHLISFAVIRHQPRWLTEGIAQFFETVALDAERSSVDVGAVRFGRGSKLPRPASISDLFAWRGHGTMAEEYELYMTARMFVAFLLNEHADALARYLPLLDATGNPANGPQAEQVQRAWDQAFPSLPAKTAYGALLQWLRFGRRTVLHVNVQRRDWSIAERRLSDADVHAIRAWSRGAPSEKAQGRAELAAALAAEPTHVLAHVLRLFEGGAMLTPDAGRAIAAAHPDDWRAWWLATIALTAGRADPAEIEQARATACTRIAANQALVAPPGLCPAGAASR